MEAKKIPPVLLPYADGENALAATTAQGKLENLQVHMKMLFFAAKEEKNDEKEFIIKQPA